MDARRLRGAVGDDEAAELAARALDRVVELAGRDAEALGDQLEVVDQRLHRGTELVAGRQHDLAVVGDVRPLGQAVEALLEDPDRLAHLGDPAAVAVVAVADGPDGDLEVDLVVGEEWVGLPQVPRLAGRAQKRAGDAELEQALARDDPDVLGALEEDLVLVEQRLELVDARGHDLDELAQLPLEAQRDVLEDAADLEVARVHPLAGRHLEHVEHRVALAEAVPEHRDRAEVQGRGAEPDQVRVDPVQLHVDHPQVLGAVGDLQLEQLLDAAAVGLHVEEVAEVVHPLHVGDGLPVALLLAGLLDTRVDVADDRLQVQDLLALQGHDQAQHPVGRRVVRPHVDRHQLLLGLEVALDVGRAARLDRDARGDKRREGVLDLGGDAALGDEDLFVAERFRLCLGGPRHYSNQRGEEISLCVKRTGSPPTGKSRRCGQPT